MNLPDGFTARLSAIQSRWGWLLWFLILFLIGWFAFAGSLRNGFVIDDIPIVRDNPLLESPKNVGVLLRTHYWYGNSEENENLVYRPAATVSFAVVQWLFGKAPGPQHAVNLFLHILLAWVIWFFSLTWFRSGSVACAASVLFLTHPIHLEVVVMLVGRAEILAALGALTALIFLAQFSEKGKSHWKSALFSGVALGIGICAKETAVLAFPAGFLLLGFAPAIEKSGTWLAQFRSRLIDSRWWWGGMTVSFLLFLGARFLALRNIAPGRVEFIFNPLFEASLVERGLTGVSLIGRSFCKLFISVPLQVDYSFDSIPLTKDLSDGFFWLGLCLLVAGPIFFHFGKYRLLPPVSFGFLLLLAGLFFFSNLPFRIGVIFAERFLYFPSIGFCIALGGIGAGLFSRTQSGEVSRRAGIKSIGGVFALGAVVATWGWICRGIIPEYRDNVSVFQYALRNGNQRSAWLWFSLGNEVQENQGPGQAIPHYERSINIHPVDQCCYQLGMCYWATGDRERAVKLVGQAVKLNPNWFPYRKTFSFFLFQSDRLDEAVIEMERALTFLPHDAPMLVSLAAMYTRQGKMAEANQAYQRGLTGDSSLPEMWLNYARFLEKAGRMRDAVVQYREYLVREPSSPNRIEIEKKIRDLESSDSGASRGREKNIP